MFYHQHGISAVDKLVEDSHQSVYIIEVKACSRLIEYEERAAGVALGKLRSEFHALILAARQRRRGLTELDITETYILQHLDFLIDIGDTCKKLTGLIYGHIEHIGYRFTLEAHFEGLAVITLAAALLARYEYVGQEVHFYSLVTVAFACLAAATGHIEAETSRLIAAYLGLRKSNKKIAYICKHACVCCRI